MNSIVDTPDFAEFNEELKTGIREAESTLHQTMGQLLAAFPAQLRPALAPIIDQLPAQFLISQLPLYRQMDGIYKTHQRLVADNPAALPEQ
jgi:hypothetical protein